MPSFSGIEVTVQADIDFEVFCGTCGAGLCNVSDTRESRSRRMPQVTVEACANCMENAKDEGREEAESEYEQQLSELRKELAEATAACHAYTQRRIDAP